MRASTRFCAALAVGCAALAPACSSPDAAVQSGTAASPVPQSTGQLPQAEPASGGCAAKRSLSVLPASAATAVISRVFR